MEGGESGASQGMLNGRDPLTSGSEAEQAAAPEPPAAQEHLDAEHHAAQGLAVPAPHPQQPQRQQARQEDGKDGDDPVLNRRRDSNKAWAEAREQVVLNIEYMSDRTTKVLLIQFRLALACATTFLAWECALKFGHTSDTLMLHNNSLVATNAAVACVCLTAVATVGGLLLWRIWRVNRAGKKWAFRRKRTVVLFGIELAIQAVNLVFYLAPNALILDQPCSWFLSPIHIFGGIRWTCWNSLFCLFLVQAHSSMPSEYGAKDLARHAVRLAVQAGQRVAHWVARLLPEGMVEAAGRRIQVSARQAWQQAAAADAAVRQAAAAAAAAGSGDIEQAEAGPTNAKAVATAPAGAPGVGKGGKQPQQQEEQGAHGQHQRQGQELEDELVGDLPFTPHLFKAIALCLPCQVVIVMLLMYIFAAFGSRTPPCSSLHDTRCYPWSVNGLQNCRDWPISCFSSDNILTITGAMSGLLVMTLLVYFLLLSLARRELAKRPYVHLRIHNIVLQTQLQTRMWAAIFFLLCNILLWYVDVETCASYFTTWLGMTPMQLVMTSLVVSNCISALPTDPSQKQLELHVWLQDFAWMEADLPRKLADRPVPVAEPMFCVETALKMFCWSWLVYEDTAEQEEEEEASSLEEGSGSGEHRQTQQAQQQQPQQPGQAPAAPPPLEGDVDKDVSLRTAMGLYRLTHHRVLRAPEQDTKCLISWGEGTIVVAFRGTISLHNMLNNLKVWRASHPPVRGSYWLFNRPMVHWGFTQCWQVSGLKDQVMSALQDILSSSPPLPGGQPWRLLFTGHSLGGALASLAAYDAVQMCVTLAGQGQDSGSSHAAAGPQGKGQLPGSCQAAPQVRVQCYTFGSPRPGNHAFARDYGATVPDSFDVIHSDDTITHNGKFLVLYKRAAHRVVLSPTGDIMVRPSRLELAAREGLNTSLAQHLLTAYGRSFAALIRGQFQAGREHNDGRRGCRALLQCGFVQQVLRATAGLRQESLAHYSFPATASAGGEDQHLASGGRLPSRQQTLRSSTLRRLTSRRLPGVAA